MKHKWGVMAILLPLPNEPLILTQLLKAGDRLSSDVLSHIIQEAPVTLPLSLFSNRKLVLSGRCQPYGSFIASFHLESLQQLDHCRAYTIIITSKPIKQHYCYIRSQKNIIEIQLPVVTHHFSLQNLFVFKEKPHIIWIDTKGSVQAVLKGTYVTPKNIKELSGIAAHQISTAVPTPYSTLLTSSAP